MISGNARLAGVIGYPVAHSRSPMIHGEWLARYGVDGAYVPLRVAPEDIGPAITTLPKLGFRGVNVTIPHKETVVPYLNELTTRAQRAGAVNTIVFQEDGTSSGDNTDGFGFLENLRWRTPGFVTSAGEAVVLGAGGAARAIAAALLDEGCPKLTLVNRNVARAEDLARMLGGPIEVRDWRGAEQALENSALLVNTTCLGMIGQPPLNLSLERLPRDALVTDIVYAPLTTDLLRDAQNRGNPVVDGLGMPLHQARPGFSAWFGVEPHVDEALWDLVAPK